MLVLLPVVLLLVVPNTQLYQVLHGFQQTVGAVKAVSVLRHAAQVLVEGEYGRIQHLLTTHCVAHPTDGEAVGPVGEAECVDITVAAQTNRRCHADLRTLK